MRPGRHPSGSEIRRLLQLRERIKVESLQLPRPLQHRLLELLEAARPWQVPPQAVPEMSRGEMIRAIRWRLGTIPMAGAVAAAEFIDGLRTQREKGHAPPRRRPR